MMLFENIVKNILEENCTNFGQKMEFVNGDPSKGFYLYHTTFKKGDCTRRGPSPMDVFMNILKTGMRRQHSNTNQGLMYGDGAYTTYTFLSSKYNVTGHGWYGTVIVKLICHSDLRQFIIFDPEVCKQVHGTELSIEDQLKYCFGKRTDKLNEFLSMANSYLLQHYIGTFQNSISKHFTRSTAIGDKVYTSVGAQTLWQCIEQIEDSKKMNVRRFIKGVVYSGGNDGNCCVPFDFSSTEPIAYTKDLGQTWVKNPFVEDWSFNELMHNHDLHHELKDHYNYYRTEGFKDGYAIVGKNNKFRILSQYLFDKKFKNDKDISTHHEDGRISDLWFDEVYGSTFDFNHMIKVKYKNEIYFIKAEKRDKFDVYDDEGHFLCDLKYLDNFSHNNNNKPQKSNNIVAKPKQQISDDDLDDY